MKESMFLINNKIFRRTGRKMKSTQIHTLRRMGFHFL